MIAQNGGAAITTRTLVACTLLISLLSGCVQDQRAWTSEDEWYNPPPPGTRMAEWEPLTRDGVREVAESRLRSAESLLQDGSSMPLTNEEASDLIGEPMTAVPGTQPYLVRGLVLNRGLGSFSVYLPEDQVAVKHGSLGRSAVPMTRQPLVLQLGKSPVVVYVAVSMAE